MGRYINPFTDIFLFLSLIRVRKNARQVLKMDLCFEVYGSIGKIAFYGTEEDIQSSC